MCGHIDHLCWKNYTRRHEKRCWPKRALRSSVHKINKTQRFCFAHNTLPLGLSHVRRLEKGDSLFRALLVLDRGLVWSHVGRRSIRCQCQTMVIFHLWTTQDPRVLDKLLSKEPWSLPLIVISSKTLSRSTIHATSDTGWFLQPFLFVFLCAFFL